ncbi:MAG: diacylglycerol/lipid kinase family protein [Fidelibacterota bacterium]
MKILMITNPGAGFNKGLKAGEKTALLLKGSGIEVDHKISRFPGHTIEIIKNHYGDRYDAVVGVGGDGTLYEIINGIFKVTDNPDIPIGIIPVGTGNSFSRDINVHSIEDGVEAILSADKIKVDVGIYRWFGKQYYFINVLGVGFVADVCKKAYNFRNLGALSYIMGVFIITAGLKSFDLQLTIDGEVYKRKNCFIEFCNSRYTAGNMLMAPHARLDDGYLDIILLNDISKFGLIRSFPSVFTGKHVKNPHVEVFKGKQINVITSEPKVLTPDGEVFGTTPIEVDIRPQAVYIFKKGNLEL